MRTHRWLRLAVWAVLGIGRKPEFCFVELIIILAVVKFVFEPLANM